MNALETAAEAAGRLGGRLLSPVVGLATRLRGTRLLHAEGQTYTADAFPAIPDPRLVPLAGRLSGAALVRLSAALWRSREWPDVLGLGLRFFGRPKARPDSAAIQDVLLVSAPSFLGLALGFIRTDPHDFLANSYNGLAPFEADGIGPVRVRASWPAPSPQGSDRFERLMAAVATERAEFLIELQPRDTGVWSPLLRVRLRVPAMIDERRTRFSPFLDRGGLRPTGFVQALRRAPYMAGQKARGVGSDASNASGRRTPPSRSTR